VNLRLHAFEPASRANGPGLRAVVWFQGCTLGCPSCFNPATHDPTAGTERDTADLAQVILAQKERIEGVTVSGGEPFQQPAALLDLLQRVSATGLSRLVFTGYTLAEAQHQSLGPEILRHVDVLIAGRYVESRRLGHELLSSTNQQIHLLTGRHTAAEFAHIPRSELILHADGSITLTGIGPDAWLRR